jgi:hypothetical protein
MYTFDFLSEVIHGDRYRVAADVIVDGKIDEKTAEYILSRSCVIFCKTDYVFSLFELVLSSDHKYILITHNSDYAINEEYFDNRPECIIKWYALNVAVKRPELIPIPSGMERPLGGGYSSDATVLHAQLQKQRVIKNLVYMNHNVNNNHGERDFVTEYLKDKPWVTWRPHGTSFKDFIENCHSHRFVASPPGNGIDCHRTWEALYMGAIPIVKRSVLTQAFVDLPILIVEDWSVLTEELLSIVYDEFSSREFNYDKLKLSYWVKEISEARRLLDV